MNCYRPFVDHVTGLLVNDLLDAPLFSILQKVPDPFFTAPASSSGKFHPAFALGEGGLVRHTLVCIHIARDLAAPYGLMDELDTITIAAALHDTYKGGQSNKWSHTVDEHPALAADAIFDELAARCEDGYDLQMYLPFVHAAFAVEGHMSVWGQESKAIGNGLNALSSLVATADYMASRKYLEPSAELAELLSGF